MRLLAIDPGNEESAFVLYDTDSSEVLEFEKLPNGEMLTRMFGMRLIGVDHLAIEMPVARGMPASNQLFETCVWIGRFVQAWRSPGAGLTHEFVDRAHVKLHVCHDSRAKDSNVRAALIDRYGGKEKAIGRKATPGPLYGLSGDCWSALAVAVTVAETARAMVHA